MGFNIQSKEPFILTFYRMNCNTNLYIYILIMTGPCISTSTPSVLILINKFNIHTSYQMRHVVQKVLEFKYKLHELSPLLK